MAERIRGLIGPAGKYNLHTHSVYCDGKDKPEDMVKRALELDFQLLGFSGHGFAPHDLDCCMTAEGEESYRQEILGLKEKYKNQIDIRLGIEKDLYAEDSLKETGMKAPEPFDYDYIIGSTHYVKKDGVYLSVDNTAEIMEHAIEEHFRGRVRDYVECYFETEAGVLEKTGADIVGHFDLVCKFNEGGHYWDEKAEWYRDCGMAALEKIASQRWIRRKGISDFLGEEGKPVFEINMGGMAKEYRSRPYPDFFFLDQIQKLGCPLILSSDCHNRKFLDYHFQDFKPE
jgi:histidinol-phosphatase (PHP family)